MFTCLSLTQVFCAWVWPLLNLQKSKYAFTAVRNFFHNCQSAAEESRSMHLRGLCPRKSIYGSRFKNKTPHGDHKAAWWAKALLDKPGDLRPEFHPWNLQKDRENQHDRVDP